jgi:uncharacterized protein involved in exopolysaccharide biosynthesis
LVFIAAMAGSLFYVRSLPPEYTGTAVVQFNPRATENGGVVGAESVASGAAGYVAYLGAPSTFAGASDGAGVTPEQLKSGLKVTMLPATSTVTVEYTSGSPELAAKAANVMAKSAVDRAEKDSLVSAQVLAPASVPRSPSGPQRTVLMVAGLLLSALLAGVAFALIVIVPARGRALGKSWVNDTVPAHDADGAAVKEETQADAMRSESRRAGETDHAGFRHPFMVDVPVVEPGGGLKNA